MDTNELKEGEVVWVNPLAKVAGQDIWLLGIVGKKDEGMGWWQVQAEGYAKNIWGLPDRMFRCWLEPGVVVMDPTSEHCYEVKLCYWEKDAQRVQVALEGLTAGSSATRYSGARMIALHWHLLEEKQGI